MFVWALIVALALPVILMITALSVQARQGTPLHMPKHQHSPDIEIDTYLLMAAVGVVALLLMGGLASGHHMLGRFSAMICMVAPLLIGLALLMIAGRLLEGRHAPMRADPRKPKPKRKRGL